MYFLEFDEMNNQGTYCIGVPLYVDYDYHVSNDNGDYIDQEDWDAMVTSCVKELLDPLVKFIGDDPDMKIYDEGYDGSDSYIVVSCSADKVNSCVDKLTAKCKELNGSFIEDKQEFDLDRDEPYVQGFDPSSWYGYYERPYRWIDDDERYEYYHATLRVKVTFEYDKRYLEIYRE